MLQLLKMGLENLSNVTSYASISQRMQSMTKNIECVFKDSSGVTRN